MLDHSIAPQARTSPHIVAVAMADGATPHSDNCAPVQRALCFAAQLNKILQGEARLQNGSTAGAERAPL
jgi:hypothetical protein